LILDHKLKVTHSKTYGYRSLKNNPKTSVLSLILSFGISKEIGMSQMYYVASMRTALQVIWVEDTVINSEEIKNRKNLGDNQNRGICKKHQINM